MTLFVRQAGHGAPLVFLHGLFGDGANLRGVSRSLESDYRTVLMDLPGHGCSSATEPPVAVLDLPGMAEMVADTLTGLALETYALVGHSLGGKVAMQLALTHPERVRALAVLDIAPVAYPPGHEAVFEGLTAVVAARPASRGEAERILADFVVEPAVRGFLLKSLTRTDDGYYDFRMDVAGLETAYPALSAAPVATADPYGGPVLLLRGEHSPYVDARGEAACRRLFPRARVETVPDTGHWLHAEAPETVVGLLRDFLAVNP